MSEPKPMDEYTRGRLDARRAFAEVWADATDNEIDVLDFTPERLRTELQSRWLERRSLSDGTVPAVGQRVVTVREVAERWGLAHGHDEKVHEITSLLGGDCHLVECGPEQIGVGMLRLAPAGSEVTCSACRGWHVENERRRIDAQVFRETQFKVAELIAARDRHAQRAEECDRERSDMSEAWDVLCAAVIEILDLDSEQDESIEDCEPDNASELAHALRALRHDHLTETAGLISNAAAVQEQHSARVARLLGRIETLEAEARLRARVSVEAGDPS